VENGADAERNGLNLKVAIAMPGHQDGLIGMASRAQVTKNGKAITDPTSGFDPQKPYLNRDPRLRFTMYVDGDALPSGILFSPTPGGGGADEVAKTQYNTTTGFSLKKYCSAEDYAAPGNSGLNFILLRYAEVLLTYAEAKIEQNQNIAHHEFPAVCPAPARMSLPASTIAPRNTPSMRSRRSSG